MNSTNISSSAFSDSKSHYKILDALRGVAAILVVMFHIMETFTGGDNKKQIINHGYLAVDFFFVLSGFVIGYAYDDRWNKMSLKGFFKRRLIRLHPMIIMGMIIGAITFYWQDSAWFPNIASTPVWKMILVMFIGFTLLPVPISLDIRGWTEMHPLNGPAWSLFFEYIANILYALFVRKFSNKVLAFFVFLFGIAFIHLAVTKGEVIGGWSIDQKDPVTGYWELYIGFVRLLYPFFAGLLLSRIVKPGAFNNAFLWSSLLLIVVLSIPRIGGAEHIWMNGLYVALCVILIFPFIVYVGASGELKTNSASRLAKFLGDISYPLYIIHYPLIYMFTGWVANHNATFEQSIPRVVLLLVSSIVIAYSGFKFYDVPVRKWLTKRFMPAGKNS
ncbi:MAG: acyltransferase [Bacteroidota bacterium]|nr:acyltransferase [Bacteroidota bacterium]